MSKNAEDISANGRPVSGQTEVARDNILLLRVLYNQIINNDDSCIVTYIDYSAAFDSVSHKYMDATLVKAGA